MYEPTPAPAPSLRGGGRKTKGHNSLVTTKPANNSSKVKMMEGTIRFPKKPKATHYLAAEMGLDDTKKRKRIRKKSPVLDLDNIPDLDLNGGLEYEHRTVNSIADDSEFGDDAPVVPKKRLRRKPLLIDSEVDIMRTKEARPPLNMSLLLPRHPLSAIKEHVSENEIEAKHPRNRRKKLNKSLISTSAKAEVIKLTSNKIKRISPNMSKLSSNTSGPQVDPTDKYPVLKNQELIKRFLKVDFTNNQKGRIRQVLKDILRGTSTTLMPDVINTKIQAILKSSDNLNDTDLRKIRVLYNMLKKATEDLKKAPENTDSEDMFKRKIEGKEVKKDKEDKKEDKPKKKKVVKEAPGMKRYVVFVGNMPLNVSREQILTHFSDIRDYIKDVRIPQVAEDKKSSYAYVELDNAPVYEMALSKHHSMMGSKRINVLYTTPNKKSKITKTEAKAKSAKLVAMAKKGQLVGSAPLQKKRSQRRAKARAFQRAAEKQMEAMAMK